MGGSTSRVDGDTKVNSIDTSVVVAGVEETVRPDDRVSSSGEIDPQSHSEGFRTEEGPFGRTIRAVVGLTLEVSVVTRKCRNGGCTVLATGT